MRWKLVRSPTCSRVYCSLHVMAGTSRILNLGRLLRRYARALRRNASRSLYRRSRSSGFRGAPLRMKPKPVLYGSGTSLAVGGLGVEAPRLAESRAPVFADAVLLNRGRTIAAAGVLSQLTVKNDDDEIYLPELRTGSLDMERVTRIFSVRMREVIFTEGIAEEIRKCKSAKQKVIQGGCLGLKE